MFQHIPKNVNIFVKTEAPRIRLVNQNKIFECFKVKSVVKSTLIYLQRNLKSQYRRYGAFICRMETFQEINDFFFRNFNKK